MSHLLNIDATLAETVADELGLAVPDRAVAARAPITDLAASDKLSIVKNGPANFKGRKLGILLSDGADARSEEHTSELPSLMRISYAVFCLKKKKLTISPTLNHQTTTTPHTIHTQPPQHH